MIRLAKLTYQYPRQERPTLHNLDWAIEPGSFVLVSGPSGSGKSTLLRSLNGLVPHFHGGRFGGHVEINGADTRTHSTGSLSLRVGFVSQDPEASTVMDRVADEIAFGPENHGLTRDEIRLRVEEALDLLGIAGLRNRTLATLSGGERQRVAIASIMAMRPAILALDEPTSQLDPWAAEEVLTVLERFNADLGTTIVLVEHRLERVLGAAERLVVLNASGRITADGPPAAVASALSPPPPLVELGQALGWQPLPMTVRDARRAVARQGPDPSELPPPPNLPGTRGSAVVEIEDLTFSYGAQPVLQCINVALHSGSVTAIMGRNGAGKTTLLKHINGLVRPGTGRVVLHGQNIAGRSTVDLARVVGYLPQNPTAMLFNESLEAELQFTLHSQRRQGDIAGTLELLGLADLRERHPFDLSSGERQRAALAAVLVANPSVLLLDEPTRGMDYERKRQLTITLKQLASSGTAVVLATHDVELVASTADRVLLLGDRQVIADGSPQEVLAGSLTFAPQTNRVFGGTFLTVSDIINQLGLTPAARAMSSDGTGTNASDEGGR